MADDFASLSLDARAANKLMSDLISNANDIAARSKEFAGGIAVIAFKDIQQHFKDEEGPDGPWPEWSESYKATLAGLIHFRTLNGRVIPFAGKDPERKTAPPTNMLQDTGVLRNSFTPASYRTSSTGITWYNAAKTKTGFPYAFAHDEGGEKLPKRSFMWLSKDALEDMAVHTLKFMTKKN